MANVDTTNEGIPPNETQPSSLGGIVSTCELVSSPDLVAPIVSGFDPSPGSPLEPTQLIGFVVTDNSGLFRRIIVHATFVGASAWEVVHDGTTFRAPYASSSTRVEAPAGTFTFSVFRDGGWPGGPSIEVFAIDAAGNEAA